MKIDISPKFVFALPLTVQHIDALIMLSRHHYDAHCRLASSDNGFLTRWRKWLAIDSESYTDQDVPSESYTDQDVPSTHASADELDTCMKLLEIRSSLAAMSLLAAESIDICNELTAAFHGAMQLANRKFTEWRATYDSATPFRLTDGS